jgi:hypothetical protein
MEPFRPLPRVFGAVDRDFGARIARLDLDPRAAREPQGVGGLLILGGRGEQQQQGDAQERPAHLRRWTLGLLPTPMAPHW